MIWTVAAVLLQCIYTTELKAESSSRPNIVLIMADDQGWADTGYYGHPLLKTPNLDKLAGDGLRLDRFYAAAPVCSPTRGSVLTGRHPYRYGIRSANVGHMRPEEHTMAELLQKAGYATGHFGKWHLGTLTKTVRESNRGGPKGAQHYAPPWDNGFQATFSTEAKTPTWDPLLRPRNNNSRQFWEPVKAAVDAVSYGTNYWSNGKRVTDNLRGDDSRVIMDRAIPFIESSVRQRKPFLAVIWFHAPHLPVVAGPKYSAMYAKESAYRRHYLGCITALDEQVGRLRKSLKQLGADQDTLICYCADNGPEGQAKKAPGSAGELRGRKRDLFEGGIRVPGIMVWPKKIKGGRSSSLPVCTSDLLPTVLDVTGLSMPDERPVDGVSLRGLIEGSMKERPRSLGFESGNQVAWIGNRYKLIRVGSKGRNRSKRKKNQQKKSTKKNSNATRYMLFDLVSDPGEKKDLAASQPEFVSRLIRELETWRASCRRSAAGEDY